MTSANSSRTPCVLDAAWMQETSQIKELGGGLDPKQVNAKGLAMSRRNDKPNRRRRRSLLACVVVTGFLSLINPLPALSDTAASAAASPDSPKVVTIDRDNKPAIPCSLYRPPHNSGDVKPTLIIHLYGHNGSHRSYNLGSEAFKNLRRMLWDRGQIGRASCRERVSFTV